MERLWPPVHVCYACCAVQIWCDLSAAVYMVGPVLVLAVAYQLPHYHPSGRTLSFVAEHGYPEKRKPVILMTLSSQHLMI